jgi:hypothetical protein
MGIITVYSANNKKPIITLCWQNSESLNVKAGGTYWLLSFKELKTSAVHVAALKGALPLPS